MEIDDDLAAWIAGLDDLFALVAGRFFRVEPRLRARAYVRGLLAPLASKNGWTLAEAAGNATPERMQRLLNRATWRTTGPGRRARLCRRYLGSPDGVLVIGKTGFLKKSTKSAGVRRQGRPGGELPAGRVLRVRPEKRARPDRPRAVSAGIADRDRCRAAAIPYDLSWVN